MKKLAFAAICTLALVGFVMADEFNATIKKIDGNTVSFTKKGKKGDPGEDGKADASADVKVAKGEIDPDKAGGAGGKKGGGGFGGPGMFKAGEKIENGLKNDIFTKIDAEKGVFANITTDDKGKITQILVIQGFVGGKGKKGG